jgi:hypothetical protein
VYEDVAPGASPAWTWSGPVAGAYAGGSVASAGDLNGDGRDELIVGTHGSSAFEPAAAAAWLFYGLPAAGPLVSAGAPITVDRGEPFSLSSPSVSSPGTEAIVSCDVEWDDATAVTTLAPCDTAALAAETHAFMAGGLHTVRVTAIDVLGLTADSVVQIRVRE